MTSEITTYLKYANLQMAAESLFGITEANLPGTVKFSNSMNSASLLKGNNRSSKFTQTQADQFIADGWTVIEHKANTSTGFSGTLFKYAGQTDAAKGLTNGELVLSFRSTEFLDDNARDNKATNEMEIKAYGWAFGQIADMEEWYAELNASPNKLFGKSFAVTGYSLGGHLATAFGLLRQQAALTSPAANPVTATYTFNGAGVGTANTLLSTVIERFVLTRANVKATAITDTGAAAVYDHARAVLDNNPYRILEVSDVQNELDYLRTKYDLVGVPGLTGGSPIRAINEYNKQLEQMDAALVRVKELLEESKRVAVITDSDGKGLVAAKDRISEIAGLSLDYQIAVLSAKTLTNSYNSDLFFGTLQAIPLTQDQAARLGRGRENRSGLSNFYDVYGSSFRADDFSAVSNSQLHYGQTTPVFIEDQPLRRGNYLWTTTLASARHLGVKLISDGFDKNDFGDSHSLVLIVDSLALQNTLTTLDSNLKKETIVKIYQQATQRFGDIKLSLGTDQGKAEGDLLENLGNSLAKFFGLEANLKGNPSGGSWFEVNVNGENGKFTGREQYQKLLSDINEAIKNKGLAGRLLIRPSETNLAAAARNDFGAIVALQSLSPMWITGKDAAADVKLKQLWQATRAADFAAWEADKSSATPQEFTDRWIKDRAAMLNWRLKINNDNTEGVEAGDKISFAVASKDIDASTVFYDTQSKTFITVAKPLSPLVNPNRVVFGDSGADEIYGIGGDDRLYGGAGADTINGQAGDDYIEGNTGNDTLVGGYGRDTLYGGQGDDTLYGDQATEESLEVFGYGDALYGGQGNDFLYGGSGNDSLDGGAGDDSLTGGDGNDSLQGGQGIDIYKFDDYWGKDTITDSDGKGTITITSKTLGYAQGVGKANTWAAELGAGSGIWAGMAVFADSSSATGKKLIIVKGVDTANTIIINNFDLTKALSSEGYLGIKLDNTQHITLTQGNGTTQGASTPNVYADNNFKPATSLNGKRVQFNKGSGASFSVSLAVGAKAGDKVTLAVNGELSGKLKAILGDSTVDASGATITLKEGQTLASFALVSDSGIDTDLSGAISVSFSGEQDGGESATSNSWDVTVKDTGEVTRTYLGDQRAKLIGTETQTSVTPDRSSFGTYAWSETSWQADGTLANGVAEAGFADVIYGSADRDKIDGLGGQDVLDGRGGNDQIDGGDGNDMITGGAGSDDIKGGAGDDFISSSSSLIAPQRKKPTDSWSPPAGEEVKVSSATWGVYIGQEAGGGKVTVWDGIGNINSASFEGDVIDGGAGNDDIIASWGADRIMGGDGNDKIDGLAGDDILEGGDGDDIISADGITKTGYLNSVEASLHGADFVDGGAGKDNINGGGGADQLFGGAGDDLIDASIAPKSIAGCACIAWARGRLSHQKRMARSQHQPCKSRTLATARH